MDHDSISLHLDVHLDEHLGAVEVADEQPLPIGRAVRPERTPAAVLIPDDQRTRRPALELNSAFTFKSADTHTCVMDLGGSVEPPNALNAPIIKLKLLN